MIRRTPLRRTSLSRRRKPLPRVNRRRAAQRRERDFGEAAEYVREQPCCVCSRWSTKQRGRTEVHHEPPRSLGGTSADLVPLCIFHHRRRHTMGANAFWNEAAMSWEAVRDRMRERVGMSDSPVSEILGGPW